MSSDSSEASDTKVYKLRSRRHFPIWKQKTLSNASSRGFEQFFLKSKTVKTQDEIDILETDYINEPDETQRRIKKGELNKHKRERKKSLAAAAMLTSSVRSKDLKILAKCKLNPKLMFDAICKKYGSEEDSDLTDLLDDFKECKLKGKRNDPEDWFGELDEINEQLEKIDNEFKKSSKELGAHILANLPKGYRTIKKIIRMDDNYLDDLDKMKARISKHWKNTYRKKSKKNDYSSDSSDSSDSSGSDEEDRKRTKSKKKDKYALNIEDEKKDSYNRFGTIVCGHCNKVGHGMDTCWSLHGKPKGMQNNSQYGRQGEGGGRKCWICGSGDHIAINCPKNMNNMNNVNDDDDDDAEANINSLFIGTMVHCTKEEKKSKDETWTSNYNDEYMMVTPEPKASKRNNEKCKIVNEKGNSKIEFKSRSGCTSESSMSWCMICSESDDESEHSNLTRNKESERILKEILGLNEDNEELNTKASEKGEESTTSNVDTDTVNESTDLFIGVIERTDDDHKEKKCWSCKRNNKNEDKVNTKYINDDHQENKNINNRKKETSGKNTNQEVNDSAIENDAINRTVFYYECDGKKHVKGTTTDDEARVLVKGPLNSDKDMSKNNKWKKNETEQEDEVGAIYIDEDINVINEDDEWETWLADTGASCHVTNNDDYFKNTKKGGNDRIIVGDQRKCEVQSKGDVILMIKDSNQRTLLTNVRIVPEIGKNIISIGTLLKEGGTMEGTNDEMKIRMKNVILTFIKNHNDGLYYAKMKRVTPNRREEQCNNVNTTTNNESEWKKVESKEKSKWPKMSRAEAHEKWGHPHLEQLNKMAKFNKINVYGQLPKCAGCGVIKSRAAKTTRTCKRAATKNGERIFIDTTGPYPKSRGGMKYWMCAVDDYSDKSWTYFAPSKNHMITFVKDLVTTIQGLDLKVKFIRCDNAGEHQSKLQQFCKEEGITLEYTAPNTPKQNGRAEKKIHTIWQRAMVQMVNAKLTIQSQNEFWAESVACANILEDLLIKIGRDKPALANWTNNNVNKWMKHLVQFGRIGVVNKKKKMSGKMNEKGFAAMMVGYAPNHGPGTYKLYNPKTNRIIYSRDVQWMDFKGKTLESEFDLFEPGIDSVKSKDEVNSRENKLIENSSISSASDEDTSSESEEEDVSSQSSSSIDMTPAIMKKKKHDELISVSSSSDSSTTSKLKNTTANSIQSQPSTTTSNNEGNDSSSETSKVTKNSKISKPIARRTRSQSPRKPIRVINSRQSKVPIPTVTIPRRNPERQSRMKSTASVKSTKSKSSIKDKRGKKIVTGDTTPKRIHIFTEQDKGEEDDINLVGEYKANEEQNEPYLFSLNENSINKIYKSMQPDEATLLKLFTLELLSDPNTPTTIEEALASEDKDLWRKSAIAEVNNFLKRKSWKFLLKSIVKTMGRKLVGVKWVFKIKNEPDYSLRYKTRVVSKGFMQIPGVDYSEKFSPVAQASTVRLVLAMTLFLFWNCELADVEAAFLEGRLKNKAYIELPPGLVELGFMTKEEYDKTCIELQGGMYGNVDAALLYFLRFTEYATDEKGLNLTQSQRDPCLFYKRNTERITEGVIVIYVDDCVIAGKQNFINEMKQKLKQEFGVVEDGQLRKLLGVRYKWYDLEDHNKARVILNMEDKANEVIEAYEKSTGITPKIQKTPGKPNEILERNEGSAVKHKQYRSILGKLMFYVSKISPECSFATGQLARNMHNPGEQHWEAMKRIIGYIKGKKRHELTIIRPKNLRVTSFVDASYADCKETRRSSTGDINTLGGSIISWRAQKTKTVCMSSTEAEYIALTETCKEQKFLIMLLEEVFQVELPAVIHEDNEAATYLAKNMHVSPRTKHIDIRKHYAREHLKQGYGEIVHIKSEENFSDLLTKNVNVSTFQRLSESILNGFAGYEDKFIFSKHQRENI